jgi:hypothetical protein
VVSGLVKYVELVLGIRWEKGGVNRHGIGVGRIFGWQVFVSSVTTPTQQVTHLDHSPHPPTHMRVPNTRSHTQPGDKGVKEAHFLRLLNERSNWRRFVPFFFGEEVDDSGTWLVMENVLSGMKDPAVLDIKMGRETWSSSHPPHKIAKQKHKVRVLRVLHVYLHAPISPSFYIYESPSSSMPTPTPSQVSRGNECGIRAARHRGSRALAWATLSHRRQRRRNSRRGSQTHRLARGGLEKRQSDTYVYKYKHMFIFICI